MLHVNAFLEEDTKDERSAFIWKLTRSLEKCKQECANAVYDKKPETAIVVIEAINVWEQQHGFSWRVWEKKPFQPFAKKEMFLAVMVGMVEVYLSLNQV